jgi:hypothetical protein
MGKGGFGGGGFINGLILGIEIKVILALLPTILGSLKGLGSSLGGGAAAKSGMAYSYVSPVRGLPLPEDVNLIARQRQRAQFQNLNRQLLRPKGVATNRPRVFHPAVLATTPDQAEPDVGIGIGTGTGGALRGFYSTSDYIPWGWLPK